DAWTYSPGQVGLFGMSAVTTAAQFSAAKTALLDEVERIKDEPVSATELSKVVKQFMASTLATRKTMQGQAQDLGGNWMAATDLNFSERYLAAVRRVTPEDLRQVACHYLHSDNRTLYALLPTGGSPKEPHAAELIVDHPIQKF